MEAEHILNHLNEPQKEAVTSGNQPVMVVAGAGSGKTRVLVHKVAWLIAVESIAPQNIFAVTFTNKAATEMQTRIQKMISAPARGMWVGTFHGLAHRFLRLHWQEAGLQQGFQILDSDDQYRQIRRLLKSLKLDETQYPPKDIQWFINTQKDLGLRPGKGKKDPARKEYIGIYQAYEDGCERAGLVDFGELLLRLYETLKKNDVLLSNYQSRFKHILVDEFQDTNEIQYQMVKLFSGPESSTFIVGDDDQSIYRWRGAKSENMQRFQKDFEGCRIIKLEQNYRSTKTILAAANSVIAKNQERLSKELWTEGEKGELIAVTGAYDEYEEAQNIVNKITTWKTQGGSYSDAAVLYRSNAQSRVIEEALLQLNIPYRVYGGMRFFDRAEIKDVLSYLRLVTNPNDDVAFERASSMPPKGMGAKTMSQIRTFAKEHNVSLLSAASSMPAIKTSLNSKPFAECMVISWALSSQSAAWLSPDSRAAWDRKDCNGDSSSSSSRGLYPWAAFTNSEIFSILVSDFSVFLDFKKVTRPESSILFSNCSGSSKPSIEFFILSISFRK